MKLKLTTIFITCCLFFTALPAFAIDVVVSNQKLALDQEPVIEYGRTLVPMRAIFEALGATVHWDAETQTITANKNNDEIILIINKTDVIRNGQTYNLDAPAMLINGRTMVPVRFVAEALGADVKWLDTNRTVYINSTVPTSPQVDPLIQWICDKYYVPYNANDPVAGTWHNRTSANAYMDAYDTYLFIKNTGVNTYEVVLLSYEPSYPAVTLTSHNATYNTATKQLGAEYSTPFYYEGPPRGFIGLVGHQYRLSGNNLVGEYDLYTMGDPVMPFHETQSVYTPFTRF